MHDFGPLPMVHPRQVPTEMARRELMSFLIDWRKKHALTPAEYLLLLSESLVSDTSLHVRRERKDGE